MILVENILKKYNAIGINLINLQFRDRLSQSILCKNEIVPIIIFNDANIGAGASKHFG